MSDNMNNNISNNISNNTLNSKINNKIEDVQRSTMYMNLEDDIYINNVLKKRMCIKAKYLNEDIDEYILKYLKSNNEGKCITEGYVKPDSIKVIKKSVGKMIGSRFTGDATYDIIYTADVCNPVSGNIINCKVKFINKIGILGTNGPIIITVPKQLHKGTDFDMISIGDIIKIEVIAKKFALNQNEIKIVAKIWNENENKTKKSGMNKKKDELVSSDLTPILYENEYEEVEPEGNMGESENEDGESEEDVDEEEETEMLDSDEELISDNEEEDVNVKLENPDENMEMGEIEIGDEEDEDEEEDKDDEEEYESEVDYD